MTVGVRDSCIGNTVMKAAANSKSTKLDKATRKTTEIQQELSENTSENYKQMQDLRSTVKNDLDMISRSCRKCLRASRTARGLRGRNDYWLIGVIGMQQAQTGGV